jgi:UDP-glucuronate decarboxylase
MNRDNFYGPVNLGNPNEMTIVDLAKRVIALTGSSSPIVKRPLPQDDPTRRQPDISLAKRELSWEPNIVLDEGLKRTIEDFKARLATGEDVPMS